MSFELVLLVPVLVLLTVFVLWAGRGGRVALTADLAAEEAAAAAALCCEEGAAGGPDRDVLVEEMLGARPWLEFLCVGGVRPEAPAEDGVGPDGFVGESWLEFEPGSGARSGGVGVLGVRFSCETDGAVAPLRGLFPTVTFHGQASEVVVRRPPTPGVGFESTVFRVNEHESELVLVITSPTPVPQDIRVDYVVSSADPNLNYTLASPGSVTMTDGTNSATIRVVLDEGDTLHEGTETLSLALVLLTDPSTGNAVPATVAELDPDRTTATGEVEDDDPPPYLFVSSAASPCQVTEGGAVAFEVRLRDQDNNGPAPSASTVEVDVTTEDDTATAGTDYTALSLTTLTGNPVTFNPGDDTETVTVQTLDDSSSPVGEPTETFKVVLANANEASLGDVTEVTCEIVDDEVRVTVADAAVDEGDQLTFELRLDRDPSADITVDYRLVDHNRAAHRAERGTAGCAGTDDYLELSGSITIRYPHDHRQAVDLPAVTTCEDVLVEHAETFWLEISIPAGGGEAVVEPGAGAIGTIRDDDIPTVLSVGDFRGDEGTNQSFTVTLANPRAGETVTVDYVIAGAGTNPATDPAVGETLHDYTAASGSLSGTLTFPDGAASLPDGSLQHSVGASLRRDAINEADETLWLVLSDPVRAVLADRDPVVVGVQAYGEGTIVNDDAPWLSVDNATAREGEPLTFTVTLCNPTPGEDVTVSYQTQPHSAAAGRDFVADGGTLTFPGTMAVRPVSEGCGAGVTADAKSLPVQVETLNDSVEESDEEVHLVLSGQMPGHVGLGKSIGAGRIVNVSAATVRVSNPTAVEGSPLVFTISLVDNDGNPAVITEPVTVHYETADRTATAGAACNIAGTDYVAPSAGSFTFQPTDTVRAHPVPVATCTDTADEDDETVALVLTLAAGTGNAGLGDTEGTGIIEDADPPSLRIIDADAQEGETLTFEVTLVNTLGVETSTSRDVTVLAATEDGTATAGADYTPLSPRQLTIPMGATRVTMPLTVDTTIDDEVEPPETFRVVLSGAANAQIDRAVATGTINPRCVKVYPTPGEMADNMPPTITVDDVTVTEGATYFLAVSFDRPLCDEFHLFRQTLTGGAWGTASVADLSSLANVGSGVESTHSAQESECCRQTLIPFVANDDDVDENTEWHTHQVDWGPSMPSHYQGFGPVAGKVWVLDNDDLPRLSVADSSADEGDPMAFTITMEGTSGRIVNVQYRTAPASGTATATAGDDYIEVPWSRATFTPRTFSHTDLMTGEFHFLPGETVKTFEAATVDDGADDSGETFQVELRADPWEGAPLNALIVDGVAVGTILEGDLPEMRIFNASADEGESMRLRVELSETATQTVTVDYATVERPAGMRAAVKGVDYEPVVRRQLEFLAGETEKFAEVVVNPDAVTEADETFLVELANPNGAALADPSAVGTINGDTTCIDWTVQGAVPPALTVTSTDVGEGDGHITFTVRLSEPVCETASFRAQDTGDPSLSVARPVRDYVSPGAVYVPSLHTEVTFEVELVDDDIAEADEQLYLRIDWVTDPWDASGAFAASTIFDDDQTSLSVASTSGAEGGFLTFVVSLDRPSDRTVTVDYATEDTTPRSAVAGVDYRARSGTAVITAGELAATVAVFAPQDRLNEAAETFLLRLSDPTGGASLADAAAVAVGTITDDDPLPSLSVSDASVDEGGALVFAVTLDAPSGREASVGWSTRDGTARAADGDYVAAASSVVFAAGETRQTVSVQTAVDSVVESPETVFVDLRSPLNATVDVGIGHGVIRDVSDRRVVVSDASVVEGGVLAFEVGFFEVASGRDVTVRHETRADTAAAGGDYDDEYEAVSRELRIVAGDTSAMVLVPTVDDGLDEDNETLELVLSSPTGAVIVGGTASGVIIDNEPEPALSVSDVEAFEADGASASFALTLSAVSGRDVTVTYGTVDVTAAAGSDYTAPAVGAVQTIAAGSTAATVDVALVNDDAAEDVETFRLEVTGAVNAQRDDSVGVATIIDDDGLVQVLVDDPDSVYEGDGASVVFTVRLSRAEGTNPVTVVYSTADGTATSGSDYTAATSQTLTFAATETVKTVSVPLVNDDVVESAETFRLVLSSPSSNAELGDDQATALIIDDDSLPTLSVADAAAQAEGSTASFTVTLSRTVSQDVTVDYATVADPTAAGEAAATPGQDYTTTSGTLTIAARATEATTTVSLLEDSFDENTETFWLRLNNPTGVTVVDGTATGTVNDDDPLAEISIADAGATEGGALRFEVSLTPVSGRTVTVPWTTGARPAGVGAASTGSDYTEASGTLTFSPGTAAAQVVVVSLPDDVSEADETFLVQLGTPANAALDDSTAVGAIRDDDGLPRIFIADTTVDEDAGPAIFSVTLSHPSSQPVTVGYGTADGTATDPDDYAPDVVRTLTIPAAFTAGEISVFIADDALTEGTETFTVTLTDPVNAVIAEGAGTATGTVLDDDGAPRASLAAATATEGDGTIEFPVTLSHAAASDVTVRYSTFDGTAAQPGDYTAVTGTLTIPASSTTATISVTLTDDGFVEDPESFLVRLHDPAGLEIDTADAVGVIIDDDNLPLLSIQRGVRVNEDVGAVTLRVMLSRPSDAEVTVEYYATARSPLRCPAAVAVVPGTLVFAPGTVVRTFEVQIVNDTSLCSNGGIRGARVYLRNPRNAEIDYRATNAGIGVFDLQLQPCVVLGGDTVVGEDGGVAVLTVGLQRSHTENVTITLDTIAAMPQSWTVFTGSATAGADYIALSSHTVDVPAGTLRVPVEVTIVDDTDPEEAEGFGVRVSSAAGADAACGGFNPRRTIAILDDDSTREVSVADVSVQESGTAIFVVSLDVAATSDIAVDYTTVDGTAAQPGDYTETAGTVRIPAGAPSALVEVPLVDDTDTEPDETFTLRLTGAAGAGIADDEATATINDNDGSLPVVRLAHDETIDQGLNTNALIVRTVLNDGDVARVLESGHGDFFAFLDDPATTPVTFSVNLTEVPSLGELAASRSEFAIGGGITNLSIMDGDTDAWVSVHITKDNIPELDERFLMVLNDAVDARLEIGHVWVEIIDDDMPIVTVADVAADESAGNVVFNVQLHAAAVHPASLRYTTRATRAAGDGAASPGEDYTTVSGTVDIPAGATSATISVPIIADTADERDETFLLELSEPEQLSIGDSAAVGTIVDDDPGFWIDNRSVWENAGSMDFTVQRDHTSASAVTVNYRIGTGGSATGGTACTVDGADYKTPYTTPAGTVTMPAAATEVDISIEICNDDDPEGRENILVELTNVTGRQTTGVGTIVDDDRTDLPRINIGDSPSRTETVHATAGARFQISAAGPLTDPVTVTWRTENCLDTDTQCSHSAAAGSDYTANSGTVTLTPTNTSATVTVTVLADTTHEDDEQFFVRLTGVTGPAAIGSGATHTDPVGIGFITDDD